MAHRERVTRGEVSSEHIVQLFDTPESLAEAVAAFAVDGFERGERLLVVARPRNWTIAADRLRRRGIDPVRAIADGRLVVLDAAETMDGFMRSGRPDAELFDGSVGALVRRLADEREGGLRIYGEMVELLAEEGNFAGARELEALWNELALQRPFTLLCGYSAAHFACPDTGHAALDAICCAHTEVRAGQTDMLSAWLLGEWVRLPEPRVAAQ